MWWTAGAVWWLLATVYRKLFPKELENEEEHDEKSWLDFVIPVAGILACGALGILLALQGLLLPGILFGLLAIYQIFVVVTFGAPKDEL